MLTGLKNNYPKLEYPKAGIIKDTDTGLD